jgi:hypothetical protein
MSSGMALPLTPNSLDNIVVRTRLNATLAPSNCI